MPNSHTVLLHKRRAGMTLVKSSMAFFFFFWKLLFFWYITPLSQQSCGLKCADFQVFCRNSVICGSRGPHDLLELDSINPSLMRGYNCITLYSFQCFCLPIISEGFFCCCRILNTRLGLRWLYYFFSFFAGNQIFLEQAVITIGAALVTESCVISQLVCYSLDSSTVSEII